MELIGQWRSRSLSVLRTFLHFLFPPQTDKWLGALRVGVGLVVIVYALFLTNDWHYLFASTGKGLVSRSLGEAITSFDSPFIPTLGWLVALGNYVHIGEDAVLSIAWASLLCMGVLLLIGLFSRPAAIIAWFLHLCAAESGGLFAYGADNFMTTALFYLMLSPLPDRYSLDHRLLGTRLKDSRLLGFWRRVLQVHMCFIYFIGGLAKCLGSGWWDGSNLWLSLTRPPFNLVSPDLLIRFKYALPILGISICLIELGYPFFIWIRKTRLVWLVCIVAMHVGIGLAMGMYLFALVMIVLNLAAFGIGTSSPRSVASQAAPNGHI
ncbi:MAG TPA: HTTM domain-containing protein [Candidatus Udaeobacter sp.]|nr:HTTM domain-containing protein [Candidatus Udaeobacter sp.]